MVSRDTSPDYAVVETPQASWSVPTDDVAAPLVHAHVAPASIGHLPDELAYADELEAAGQMERDRCGVLREDAGLERPEARLLGGFDQRIEQRATDSPSGVPRVDVDAHLRHTAIHGPGGERAERRPAEHLAGRP